MVSSNQKYRIEKDDPEGAGRGRAFFKGGVKASIKPPFNDRPNKEDGGGLTIRNTLVL